jgi:hypothetical protein
MASLALRRHGRHARVEDPVRQSKAAGLNNFPCWAQPRTRRGWVLLLLPPTLCAGRSSSALAMSRSSPMLRSSVTPYCTWLLVSPAPPERCTCGLTVAGLGRQRFARRSPTSGRLYLKRYLSSPLKNGSPRTCMPDNARAARGPTRRSPSTVDDGTGASGPPWDGVISGVTTAVSAPQGDAGANA